MIVSPLGTLIFTLVLGVLLPAPYAGFVLAPFGTWFILIPDIAGVLWMWNHLDAVSQDLIGASEPS